MDFTADHIKEWLDQTDDKTLDALPYGVIAFDLNHHICRYNAYESKQSLLTPASVIGRNVFTEIAICMNNALVAKRFEDAAEKNIALDATIDYVIAFKSGAGPARMRLLHVPDSPVHYLLIKRLGETR